MEEVVLVVEVLPDVDIASFLQPANASVKANADIVTAFFIFLKIK